MTSQTTRRFREAFRQLPTEIQQKARESFQLWREDPWNPRLQFKPIHSDRPVYSVRFGLGWRAVGVKTDDAVIWFWIGSHAEYDKLVSQLRRGRGPQTLAQE